MWVPVAVWQPCELLYTCYLLTYLLTYVCARNYFSANKWTTVVCLCTANSTKSCLKSDSLFLECLLFIFLYTYMYKIFRHWLISGVTRRNDVTLQWYRHASIWPPSCANMKSSIKPETNATPQEDRATAIGNMRKNWWRLEVYFRIYACGQTHKHTYRHARHNTPPPLPGPDQRRSMSIFAPCSFNRCIP